MTTQRLAVQNFIQELGRNGQFYEVTYNKQTQLAEPIDTTSTAAIKPETCMCRETGSRFGPDPSVGRRQVQKRSEWFFTLQMQFKREVSLEFFERSLCDPVPVLAASVDPAYGPAIVRLMSVDATHPPAQEPSGGTFAVVQFRVEVGRN